MRSILLTGSSGFIGSRLRLFLEENGYNIVCWNRRERDPKILEGFHAIIHLGGANIAGKRWSNKRKKELIDSRIETTTFFAKTIPLLKSPPKIFLSASAIGYYGDAKDQILTEESPSGKGFLASLSREWEAAAKGIASDKTRLAYLRFGVVLDPGGGMLKKLRPLFLLGLGGILGSGEQYMSSISLDEALKAILFCLETSSIHGPVNLVSKEPMRQKDWAKQYAQKLHRPLLITYPKWLLRLSAGEMADELFFTSQRVIPKKLMESGFNH